MKSPWRISAGVLLAFLILGSWPASSWSLGQGGGGGKKPPPPDQDVTPPAAVVDLSVDRFDSTYADLSWTATADDGDDPASGPADHYDLRYIAGVPIDEGNWGSAIRAKHEPSPQDPGNLETYTLIALLPLTYYSIGLKVVDEAGNASDLATVELTTAEDLAWDMEIVDSGRKGPQNTLVFDLSENPAIAYGNGSGVNLAVWNGSAWDHERVDDGHSIDLAYDPTDGGPSLSYVSGGALRFAHKIGSAWEIETVVRRKAEGESSLAYDFNGNPSICYKDENRGRQWSFVYKTGSTWTSEVIEATTLEFGQFCSLAYDPSSGEATVAYADDLDGDSFNDALKFARRTASGWGSPDVIESGGGSIGGDCSLDYDLITGHPAIAYAGDGTGLPENPLHYAAWDGGQWVVEYVDVGSGGYSLAFDSAGTPCIGYFTFDGPERVKKVAFRVGSAWTSDQITTGWESGRVSVAVDPVSDLPVVAHPEIDGLRFASARP